MSARAKGRTNQSGKRRTPGRHASRRRIPWIPIVLVLGALVAGFFIVRSLEIGAPGERRPASGVGQHVPEGQPVVYDSAPPVGGPHWPGPAGWGVSVTAVPDERAVHNLEHGGIVISHNGMSAEDLAKLSALLTSYPRDRYGEVKVLVRPYDKIAPGTLTLTAWGWIETARGYDEGTVRAFLDAHLNKCCESVP